MSFAKGNKIVHSYDKTWLKEGKKIPKPRTTNGWGKTNLKLKRRIRFHHSVSQDDICAYCRLPIKFGGYSEPIEHIVPKSLNSFWMYHPKNLCLACFGCNTKKKDKNTLRRPFNTYPKGYDDYVTAKSEYKIIHPHFDKFSDHIIVVKGFIYRAKPHSGSNKGKNTIKMCDLNRMDSMYSWARQKTNSKVNIYQMALKVILSSTSSKNEILAAQKLMDELVERYEYKKKLSAR